MSLKRQTLPPAKPVNSCHERDGSSRVSNTGDNARTIANAGRKLFKMPVPHDPRAEVAHGQRGVTETIRLLCKTAVLKLRRTALLPTWLCLYLTVSAAHVRTPFISTKHYMTCIFDYRKASIMSLIPTFPQSNTAPGAEKEYLRSCTDSRPTN